MFSGIWLLYLIQPAAALFGHHHSWAYTAGGLVILAAFCAAYVFTVSSWERPARQTRAGFGALFVLAAAISWPFHGNGSWIFVASAAGLSIRPPRVALRVIGAVAACYIVTTLASGDGVVDFGLTLLPTVLVGIAMIGFRRQIELTRELTMARETVARLATSEERLRLARDMHDLTGQSLSMITLKSDLAARLLGRLPAGPDRDRAREEIAQVADISRQTLHDIREAISGYRRPTLAVEVITAREALDAAGITAHDDDALTLQLRHVRRGRRGGAGLVPARGGDERHPPLRCPRLLAAADPARRRAVPGSPRQRGGHRLAGRRRPAAEGAEGTGLRGMSERLCAVGGKLEIRPGAGGFCLVASVPVGERGQPAERSRPAAGRGRRSAPGWRTLA